MPGCTPYIVQLVRVKHLKDHLISNEHCWLGNLQYNLCSIVHFKSSKAYDTRPCKPISDYNYCPLKQAIQLDLIQFKEKGHIVYVLIQSFLKKNSEFVFLNSLLSSSHTRGIVKTSKPESCRLTSCPAKPRTVNTFP